MWKYVGIAATMIAAMCGTPNGEVFGQQLVSSFENNLSSTTGTSWGGQYTTSPEFTAVGATEGSSAFVVRHNPGWLTDGLFLKAGLQLAQQASQHDFLLIDFTTTDYGVAGDGWAPSDRQVFVIFNAHGNYGGWQQAQIDPIVAADDGGSFTHTAVLDIATSGIKANAQAFVNAGAPEGHWWELFLVFQGTNQGTPIKAGDYNNNNVTDAADYIIWRDTIGGTTLPNETVSLGSVDAEDYAEWRSRFGTDYSKITTIIDNVRFANAGSGSGSLVDGAIPEPSSLVMVLAAGLALAGHRRVRFSRIS